MPKRTDNTQKAVKAPARMSKKDPLTREQLHAIDAWWRAANCLLYTSFEAVDMKQSLNKGILS